MRPQRVDSDVMVGGVAFLFALVLLVAALRIPPSPVSSVVLGPRVMPLAVSGVLAVASVVLAVRGLLRGRHAPKVDPSGQPASAVRTREPGQPPSPRDGPMGDGEEVEEVEQLGVRPGQARRFLVIASLLLAYILLFIPVGYLLSTFAFLAAVSTYVDPRKWVRNLIYAAVFSGVVYVAFTLGLNVQLPPGVLG